MKNLCLKYQYYVVLLQGFVSAVSHMRSFVPAIYDITVAIPKSSHSPTMLRLFKGQSSVVSQSSTCVKQVSYLCIIMYQF